MNVAQAHALLACVLLPACSGPAVVSTTGSLPQSAADCAPYESSPNAHGYCLSQVAALSGARREGVEALCGGLTTWAGECRVRWVRGALPQIRDTEVLLDACGGSARCALEVLDQRPYADIREQVRACEASAGDLSWDCVNHALARWVSGEPTPAELEALSVWAVSSSLDPVALGGFLGRAQACGLRPSGGAGDCPGDGLLLNACQRASAGPCVEALQGGGPGSQPLPPIGRAMPATPAPGSRTPPVGTTGPR